MKQLLQQGDTVIATARSGKDAPALQQLAASSGGRLHITDLDSSKPESIQSWAAELQSKTGRVDVSRAGEDMLMRRRNVQVHAAPCHGSPWVSAVHTCHTNGAPASLVVQLLINNAGAMEQPKPFGQVPASDLMDMFALNAAGGRSFG